MVPVKGYRGEVLNVTLTNNTFFPTEPQTQYSGLDLTLSNGEGKVTGYIFNCWEKIQIAIG